MPQDFKAGFLKTLWILEDYLPVIVIGGGWVPLLYYHYLLADKSREPIRTRDIDLLVDLEVPVVGDKTVYASVNMTTPEGGKLKGWLKTFLDRQPGINISIRERKPQFKAIHCKECDTEISDCPNCNKWVSSLLNRPQDIADKIAEYVANLSHFMEPAAAEPFHDFREQQVSSLILYRYTCRKSTEVHNL